MPSTATSRQTTGSKDEIRCGAGIFVSPGESFGQCLQGHYGKGFFYLRDFDDCPSGSLSAKRSAARTAIGS
jgi:hypothetical protein